MQSHTIHSEKVSGIRPRIIIHGGAGNITRENLPPKAYNVRRDALLTILQEAHAQLQLPCATALDVATHAVSLLENNGLFNAGHGAVFTTAETLELEASVMVSKGYRKRGVGIMNVTRSKNPILVAREMLMRGEDEDGGGAQGHVQLQGATVDGLAEQWGLEMVKPSYYWTRKRWDEHRRGLGKKCDDETYRRHRERADIGKGELNPASSQQPYCCQAFEGGYISDDPSWDGREYLPQGTVGAVVLDSFGTVCCATSTGGLTNKLPGRIGDTPTIGAGFWAEEWTSVRSVTPQLPALASVKHSFAMLLKDCLPSFSGYTPLSSSNSTNAEVEVISETRAMAACGTGNGDSFLRLSAVRTAAAMARFKSDDTKSSGTSHFPLQYAVTLVAGPNGMLQQSAEDRWHKTSEGQGGIIAIDLAAGTGTVVYDYNCGGMFHAWIDDNGKERFQVFRDEIDL